MNQQLKGIKCFDIVLKKLGFHDFFEKYCVFENIPFFVKSAFLTKKLCRGLFSKKCKR